MRWSTSIPFLSVSVIAIFSPSMGTRVPKDDNTFEDLIPHQRSKRQLRSRHGSTTYERSSVAGNMHSLGVEQTNLVTEEDLNQLRREHLASSTIAGSMKEKSNKKVSQGVLQVCRRTTLDFTKAANGRPMFGGEFVGREWYHNFGVKISAESHNGAHNLHPMIFDSKHVTSNRLDESNNLYALASPNHDCGGYGVGIGGKEGKPGENCKPLGKLLIPSAKSVKVRSDSGSQYDPSRGGVLIFDFDKLTKVESIDVLNATGPNQIVAIHDDGSLERIDLPSVEQNGFQSVSLKLDQVKEMHVKFHSFAAIAGIDLCVVW